MKDISEEPVWIDAYYTLERSSLSIVELIRETVQTDVHPPLYYVVARIWRIIVGSDPIIMRFLSVICGVIAIYLVYLLGSFLFNHRVGILSSLFQSVAPIHIIQSQNMRMYSMMTVLLLLSTYFLFRYRQDRTNKNMILYILSSSLLVYTHVYSFFLMLSHGFIMLYDINANREKSEVLSWFKPTAWIVVLASPWLFILFSKLLQSGSAAPSWIDRVASTNGDIILQTIGGVSIWFVMHPIFGILFLVGLGAVAISKYRTNLNLMYLILIIVTPVTLSPAVSILYDTITFHRYFVAWGGISYIIISYLVFPSESNTEDNLTDIIRLTYVVLISDEANLKGKEEQKTEDSSIPTDNRPAMIEVQFVATVLLFTMFAGGVLATDHLDRTPWDQLSNDLQNNSDGKYTVFVERGPWKSVLEYNINEMTIESDAHILKGFDPPNCSRGQNWYIKVKTSKSIEIPYETDLFGEYGERLDLHRHNPQECQNQ